MATIAQTVRRTLESPKAQEQLIRMLLLVLIWLWAFSIRLVCVGAWIALRAAMQAVWAAVLQSS